LVNQGNELYIIMGSNNTDRSDSNGGVTNTIADGKITVPAITWKVIVVIPNGDKDLQRVTKTTRTIAVIMTNRQDIGINTSRRNFRVSIRAVEALTGFDFLSKCFAAEAVFNRAARRYAIVLFFARMIISLSDIN
jgi:endonuclease G